MPDVVEEKARQSAMIHRPAIREEEEDGGRHVGWFGRRWRAAGGGSLAVALVAHALLAWIFVHWMVERRRSDPPVLPQVVPRSAGNGGERSLAAGCKGRRAFPIPSSATARAVVEELADGVLLPQPVQDFGDHVSLPSLGRTGGSPAGDGGFGPGGGDWPTNGPGLGAWIGGTAPPEFLQLLPEEYRQRCQPQERRQRLLAAGGRPECEQAVTRALDWMRARQQADGAWGEVHRPAMTGFALLACFGHCETPRSAAYGETVVKGLAFLINSARPDGTLHSAETKDWVYEHAIATYALCEACSFCADVDFQVPGLRETCGRAVEAILCGQHPSGFWDYGYNRGPMRSGDTSITAWHLQALRAAHRAGFASDRVDQAVDRALRQMDSVQAEDGTFGYTERQGLGERLVGAGAMGFQLWGQEKSRPAREAVRWMDRNMKADYDGRQANLYAWYYTTLALFDRGGTIWEKWNRQWLPQVLARQSATGDWPPEGSVAEAGAISTRLAGADADFYRTALCTLMLEVYYRYLPGTGTNRPMAADGGLTGP